MEIPANLKIETNKIIIPYTKAGTFAFEKIREIASEIWETGQQATAEFLCKYAPYAKTIKEYYENGTYCRLIKHKNGNSEIISYDYRSGEIIIISDKQVELVRKI
ncbi:MAG: hypothetical protein FWD71_01445 [Oscillospiraceae bacterium]|nr:hypothetical protein [Oscillospiraceae bacterium]